MKRNDVRNFQPNLLLVNPESVTLEKLQTILINDGKRLLDQSGLSPDDPAIINQINLLWNKYVTLKKFLKLKTFEQEKLTNGKSYDDSRNNETKQLNKLKNSFKKEVSSILKNQIQKHQGDRFAEKIILDCIRAVQTQYLQQREAIKQSYRRDHRKNFSITHADSDFLSLFNKYLESKNISSSENFCIKPQKSITWHCPRKSLSQNKFRRSKFQRSKAGIVSRVNRPMQPTIQHDSLSDEDLASKTLNDFGKTLLHIAERKNKVQDVSDFHDIVQNFIRKTGQDLKDRFNCSKNHPNAKIYVTETYIPA